MPHAAALFFFYRLGPHIYRLIVGRAVVLLGRSRNRAMKRPKRSTKSIVLVLRFLCG